MKILFVTHSCYLDDSNGAAIASRGLMRSLAMNGCGVEVVCGTMLDTKVEVDPASWLEGRGHRPREFQITPPASYGDVPDGPRPGAARFFSVVHEAIPVSIHIGESTVFHHPSPSESDGFIILFRAVIEAYQPDFVVGYGGSVISHRAFSIAKSLGVSTIFLLYNYSYRESSIFNNVDAVVVPSLCSSRYYRETLGLKTRVVPCIVDPSRFVASEASCRRDYVLFVNPSHEKGVYVFARIAHELGRLRPDIPFLVVEGRGTEATLVECGLDLLEYGNIYLMDHPPDPREFWRLARVCLMPSLWWESQGLVAVEAMFNGVPIIASDRGALPETIGKGGFVLPIPDRLTANTRELPTADEVGNWIDIIINLWDDQSHYRIASHAALVESRHWSPGRSLGLFKQLLRELRDA